MVGMNNISKGNAYLALNSVNMIRSTIVCFLFICFHQSLSAQLFGGEELLSRADTLRGMLTPLRTCFDVKHYDLTVKIFPDSQRIEGVNIITFQAERNFETMQLDFFENMPIESITLGGQSQRFAREFNAVFVDLKSKAVKGELYKLEVRFSGKPIAAQNPPWDGGFVWKKDKFGNPWIGVACEGIGASLWWPNKDHLSDKPDSMNISLIVPDTLMGISNGSLINEQELENGWKKFDWKVTYPMINYNTTVYVGKYAFFNDTFVSKTGEVLPLHYYVLPHNLNKAKEHFEQVKPMFTCFEQYFGKYPFGCDTYKLVEAPYLGMEHQSAIAYGNNYKSGYAGMDYSRIGLDFDYIIIHETGHEWWGNAVSCSDIADLWIHEGFCTYSEALYVECMFDYQTALAYVNAKKPTIGNRQPIIGPYNVNREGSGDMYSKGMLLLNTLRHVINNDKLWWEIIKGLVDEFSYKSTSSAAIENFIMDKTAIDLRYFFDQYLRHAAIPVFEYRLKKKNKILEYRWVADVPGFRMPIQATLLNNRLDWIYPTTEWQIRETQLGKKDVFRVAEELYYVNVRKAGKK